MKRQFKVMVNQDGIASIIADSEYYKFSGSQFKGTILADNEDEAKAIAMNAIKNGFTTQIGTQE